MQRVELSAIPNWNDTSGVLLPGSIDSVCPGCHRFVNLTLLFYDRVQRTNTYLSRARCPACNFEATVVTLNPQEKPADRDRETVVAIHPPIAGRRAMPGAETLPERVRRAYESLLSVHKAGEWTAVASLAQRVLEAIAREALDEVPPNASMHEIAALIPDRVMLGKPMHDLSAALHPAEPLGRLLSMEAPADQPAADAMVEAVEMVAQYLLLLPAQFERLATEPPGRPVKRPRRAA